MPIDVTGHHLSLRMCPEHVDKEVEDDPRALADHRF